MTFPVWLEIVCAACSKRAQGRYSFTRQVPIRDMKNDAKKQGFVFKYDEAFCCEDCAQRHFDYVLNK